ncbi:MAG: hypothetical protein WCO33_04020 [bacterium]
MINKLKSDSKKLMLFPIIISVIFLILLFIFLGFSFWLVISGLVIAIFLITFNIIFKRFGFNLLIIFFFVILFLSLSINFIFSPRKVNTSSYNASTKQLSAEECKPLIDKYNNKVLTITDNNLKGSIGIKIDSDCKYTARYIITFNAVLATNPITDFPGGAQYTYENNLHNASQTERGHYGVGVLSIAKQNFMQLPDPFSTSTKVAEFYRNPTDYSNGTSNNFYWSYERMGNFSMDRYNAMLTDNVLEVVDGLPYMVKEPSSSGGFSYSVDSERAEKEGKIVKTFNMTISE